MSPRRFSQYQHSALLGFLLVFSGCFPSACQQRESRELLPADSLSRQIAERTAIDTLALAWESTGGSDRLLQYPRTVRFGPEGRTFVSDARSNEIFEYLNTGVLQRVHTSSEYAVPYLAGVRGDTLLVFNPEMHRIDFTIEGRSVFHITLDSPSPSAPLQYTTAGASGFAYKVLGADFPGYISILDERGMERNRIGLGAPYWRYAGMLRPWGDSLLSLSGYRPVVDIVTPDGRLDSLALVGFDSPMLARSRAYMLGEIDEPPLLSSSAAAAGNLLFVLNLRPGWLRIDVFDRDGRLVKRLVQRDPDFNSDYYPIDIDVRASAPGEYELAVVLVEPEPKLVVYRWRATM